MVCVQGVWRNDLSLFGLNKAFLGLTFKKNLPQLLGKTMKSDKEQQGVANPTAENNQEKDIIQVTVKEKTQEQESLTPEQRKIQRAKDNYEPHPELGGTKPQ